MELQLVQTEFSYEPAKLIEPSKSVTHIHIAAQVLPSLILFLPTKSEKKLKALAQQLEQLEDVDQASVFSRRSDSAVRQISEYS
jgi:hypothetical protein